MAAGEQILQVLARVEAKLDQLLQTRTQAAPTTASGGAAASDSELDGQWGDEEVKDPPRWKGESHSGKRMSRCSPEFLDEYANFKDWCAGRDEQLPDEKKKKDARYNRGRAAKARGWARRIRAGWKPPVDTTPPGGGFGSDVIDAQFTEKPDPDFGSWS